VINEIIVGRKFMFKPKGVIPALVTTLDKDGRLMEQALRNVIDYTILVGFSAC
jgi:4-hydroxy-tetrahydrodipicolinate synthase